MFNLFGKVNSDIVLFVQSNKLLLWFLGIL